MSAKDRGKRKKGRHGLPHFEADEGWWSDDREFSGWMEGENSEEFEVDETYFLPRLAVDEIFKKRLEQIKQSHALLSQFTPSEIRILLELKRSGGPNAWTIHEDLLLLTLPESNEKLAEMLNRPNKEAVKKRLQLLRSKGLFRRQKPPHQPSPDATSQEEASPDDSSDRNAS